MKDRLQQMLAVTGREIEEWRRMAREAEKQDRPVSAGLYANQAYRLEHGREYKD